MAVTLEELLALHAAVKSQRDSVVRLINSRPARTRQVERSAERIRNLRAQLERELQALRTVRSISDASVYVQVDRYDARMRELQKDIALERAKRRVDKLRRLFDQLNSLKGEMREAGMALPPELVSEEDIVA